MVVEPKIIEYNFEKASKIGIIQEIDGILPGAGEGTWYVIEIKVLYLLRLLYKFI